LVEITIDTSSYKQIHTSESAFQGEMDDEGSDATSGLYVEAFHRRHFSQRPAFVSWL
jgi:hypothetical protein